MGAGYCRRRLQPRAFQSGPPKGSGRDCQPDTNRKCLSKIPGGHVADDGLRQGPHVAPLAISPSRDPISPVSIAFAVPSIVPTIKGIRTDDYRYMLKSFPTLVSECSKTFP